MPWYNSLRCPMLNKTIEYIQGLAGFRFAAHIKKNYLLTFGLHSRSGDILRRILVSVK